MAVDPNSIDLSAFMAQHCSVPSSTSSISPGSSSSGRSQAS
jgi:hypothetical protein